MLKDGFNLVSKFETLQAPPFSLSNVICKQNSKTISLPLISVIVFAIVIVFALVIVVVIVDIACV